MNWNSRFTFAAFWLSKLAGDVRGLFASPPARASVPTDFSIEPANLCNANCVFCGYQFQERQHEEIDVDLAKRIVTAGKKAGVKRLGLTPLVGEPLVHRRLEEIIRAAALTPPPLPVGLTTNGILLTPARYRTLIEAGATDINVSMTYPDEEEYERIYRSNRLEKLIVNLEGILKIFDQHPCRFTIGVRTPRSNWATHPLFEKGRAKGWNIVRNRLFDDWSGRTREMMEEEGLIARPNRAKAVPCAMLFSGPQILSDGRATACGCRDLDGKSDLRLDLGELLADARSVYQDGAVDALRCRFRQGRPPDICVACRHYNPAFAGESMSSRFRQLRGDMFLAIRSVITGKSK